MSSNKLSDLSSVKRLLFERLRNEKEQGLRRIAKVDSRAYYPTSSQQRRLYALQQLDLNTTAYNIPGAYFLEGDVDLEKVESALNSVIERHEVLRTRFKIVDGDLVQIVEDKVLLELEVEEIEIDKVETKISSFVRSFDLEMAPLLRAKLLRGGDGDCILLTDMHHIISDGTSNQILIGDFSQAFSGGLLEPLPLQYKDFSVWQQEGAGRDLLEKLKGYWIKQFNDDIPILEMPTDFSRPKVFDFRGANYDFVLNEEISTAIREYCREQGVTLYMFLLACFGITLSRWSGQEDIVIGNAVSGRDYPDIEGILGMFVGSLAMRVRPTGRKRFEEYLDEVKWMCLDGLENQQYPFEELVEGLELRRDTSRTPLFDVMLVVQNFDRGSESEKSGAIRTYCMENRTSKFDMTLYASDLAGGVGFQLEYATSLYREETVSRFAGHFVRVLESVVSDPLAKLSSIDILDATERDQLLHGFNETDVAYPRDKCVHELFELQAGRVPEEIAVICEGKALTYRELDERSNRLARTLREEYGVASDTLVALFLERSLEMIVGMLGVLKSGGAYLPLDPSYPAERIRFMLEDSDVNLALSNLEDPSIVSSLATVLDLRMDASYSTDGSALDHVEESSDLAYALYTSGSTGRPKGVLIEHRSVVNFMQAMTNGLSMQPGEAIVSATTYSFDIFVLESLVPLMFGLRVVLASHWEQLDPRSLNELIHSSGAELFQSTPTLAKELLRVEGAVSQLSGVRALLIGGEAFPSGLFEEIRVVSSANVFNMYGPTETTIWSSFSEVDEGSINIGSPIANTHFYVLGRSGDLVPIGAKGELYIGGDGLARGYLNREDLTSEKFVESPFDLGERIYRTGDLARWLADGRVECFGRIDDQVKIRGFRIELGEVESSLSQLEGVLESVVVSKELGGEAVLVAYYVSDGRSDDSSIRDGLKRALPPYMVPSFFVELDSIPLTSNGKVDRKALPDPSGRGQRLCEYVAPRDEVEEKLVEIWQEVLGIDKVGIDDDFFELGGHSLKALSVVSKMKDTFEINISLAEFFEIPKIRDIAERVSTLILSRTSHDRDEIHSSEEVYKF